MFDASRIEYDVNRMTVSVSSHSGLYNSTYQQRQQEQRESGQSGHFSVNPASSSAILSNSPDEETELRPLMGTSRSYGSFYQRTAAGYVHRGPVTLHTVQGSDNLRGISIKYNVPVEMIKRLNGLYSDSDIWFKKVLQIPIKDSDEESGEQKIITPHTVIQQKEIRKISRGGDSAPNSNPSSAPNSPRNRPENSQGTKPKVINDSSESVDNFFAKFDKSSEESRRKVKKILKQQKKAENEQRL